jgi:hypothetical protein
MRRGCTGGEEVEESNEADDDGTVDPVKKARKVGEFSNTALMAAAFC